MKETELVDYYVTTQKGRAIKVYSAGCDAGPSIFLIHGLADGAFVWKPFIRSASTSFKIFAIDLRGHGQSSRDKDSRYTFEGYVEDARDVLAQLQLERFIIIGHSLGGDIAMKIAAARPDGLLGAVLVDTGPSDQSDADRLALREELLKVYQTYPTRAAYAEWLLSSRRLAPFEILDEMSHGALARTSSGYTIRSDEKVLDLLLFQPNDEWWWSALRDAVCPLLIVRGVGSAILSQSTSRQMVAGARRAMLVTVKQAGHSVMTDNPSGFFEAVRGFLDRNLK